MSFFDRDRFLPIIQNYINEIRNDGNQEFRTINVIKKYIKHYHTDGTSPNESINANIGKFLKENASDLGIEKVPPKMSVKDDDKNPSTSSLWRFV